SLSRHPGRLMMGRWFLTALWLAVVALPCSAASLPAHYTDLLHQERFEQAEAAAESEIAKVESDPAHKAAALCAELDRSVRVNSFDLYQAPPTKLVRIEQALHCHESLADDAANAAQLTALKAWAATLAFSTGDRKRASALFDETQAQLKQYRGRLD